MKIKNTITMLSAIVALAILPIFAYSQNNNFTARQNMGATLNSAGNEVSAVISPNGLSFYFTSNRTGQADIWVSQRTSLSSAWGAPQNLGGVVNTAANESIGSLSLDGRTMFLQSNRANSLGLRDNYISTRTDPNNDFGWTTPVNLGPTVNSASDDLAATYFEDPTTGVNSIFFGSDRVGTPGFSYHIYQAVRNSDGTFNAPVPVNEINGPEVDTRVTIRRDGLEIFIASGRPGGIAPSQFDIWRSTRASTSSPWSVPTLVPGINTAVDEQSPMLSPDGSILYFASGTTGAIGNGDLYAATRCSLYGTDAPCNVNRTVADFDGDGRADFSVFRPSDGTWYVMQSGTNTFRSQQFGTNGDKIVPGDYDGDGRTDFSVFRQSDSNWYILRSSDNSFVGVQWGLNTDKPVPGDYDGDGRTDIAVYRSGIWYILQSSNGQLAAQQFGASSDIPVAAASVQ